MKVAQLRYDNGSISHDIVLMCDKVYLQKGTHYHGGDYVGAGYHGSLFSGVYAFTIIGIKKNTPVVVRAVPENKVEGD